jgi:DNA-nicking Smr family endonuclease
MASEKKSKDEFELFQEAMRDVKPLKKDKRQAKRVPTKPKKKTSNREPFQSLEEYEKEQVSKSLQDLVKGDAPMDFSFSDEYEEHMQPGVSRDILRKLRKGHYSVQGSLDLHGMNREEARKEVLAFIKESVLNNKKLVLVITGRGKRSPDGRGVLKSLLPRWLSRGAISRYVIGHATAKQWDGGVGAFYVLLRRKDKI